ncbi:MAG TPA: RDD family protein [Dehalococcoidia bacterium]|nr:RDD family protein [Dehalococcoidia bacterium]
MTSIPQVQATEEPQFEEYPALPYASAGLRIVAGILDLIVLASLGLLWASTAGFYLLTRTDWGSNSNFTQGEGLTAEAILASFALVIPLYFFILGWWKGQSVGQMAVRIIVTDRDGYHMSVWQALLRTIMTPVALIPLGLGLIPMFFDKESRALHDMISGTVVLELP